MTLITVKDTAKLIGKSEQMIRKLVKEGKLKSRSENGRHMIDPNEVVSLYQHQAATKRSTVAQHETSNEPDSTQVTLLERQIVMLEKQVYFIQEMLASERAAKHKLEEDMSAVIKEIKAYMHQGTQDKNNVLTRFFKK